MNERDAYIALNMMEKVGPVGVRALKTHLGSAAAIFQADAAALAASGVKRDCVEALLGQRTRVDWAREQERAEQAGIRLVTPMDAEYPRPLLEIHDPPLALYVKGSFEKRDIHSVAIVGTRHPTRYGLETAERLGFQLAEAGYVVVSGLAEGIDTAAHHGCLKARGRTLAVIGSGLGCVYPTANIGLAEDIARQGAVVSEFPLDRQPDKTTFPIRNRIVSGLSRGIVVVEAGLKSGAIITSNQALEQGRAVFAVPGRIDSPASRGTNDLIRHGAKLVETLDDILEEFETLAPRRGGDRESGVRPVPGLTGDEKRLADLLGRGEADVDQLIRESGLKAAAVSSLLIGLEMKKVVRMLPGRMVELVMKGEN